MFAGRGRRKCRSVAHPGSFETRLSLLTRLAKPGPVDQLAWEEFVDQYGPMIYRWCRRWGLQDADAKDVTQQVLLTLPTKLASFKYNPDGSFRAWLHTLAHHAWHDFRIRARRPALLADIGQSADSLQRDGATIWFGAWKRNSIWNCWTRPSTEFANALPRQLGKHFD